MIIDAVSYSFSLGTATVFIHKGGKTFSIADIEITDRDFDIEEDHAYMQNLAEEIAHELGYEFMEKNISCRINGAPCNGCKPCCMSKDEK